ncbi:MAG: phosphoglycolate phosphatase [Pseudomonadales bacterium]|nr:phosphoglycolate phosphatase [Pseudomonadales bacterium]
MTGLGEGRIPSGCTTWLFDLDGTLVDSAPDLHRALDATLARHGLPGVDEATVRRGVGRGARHLIEHALALRGAASGDPDVDGLLGHFLAHYEAHIADGSRLYPGVLGCLDALAARGAALACVTNKYEHLALRLLGELGIRERFGAVIGGDTLSVRKPDAGPLLEACRRLGQPSTQAVMVGDSMTDIAAARAARMPVICVTYGYNHGEDIHGAGADFLVDSLEALI